MSQHATYTERGFSFTTLKSESQTFPQTGYTESLSQYRLQIRTLFDKHALHLTLWLFGRSWQFRLQKRVSWKVNSQRVFQLNVFVCSIKENIKCIISQKQSSRQTLKKVVVSNGFIRSLSQTIESAREPNHLKTKKSAVKELCRKFICE